MAGKPFENPLIPHARMRTLFRALVETRELSARLPAGIGLPRSLEACWIASALDLQTGDLTSDAHGAHLIDYIRAICVRPGSGKPSRKAIARLFAATAKPFAGTAADRLLCAVGTSMAPGAAAKGRVIVAYAAANELTGAEWLRVLRIASDGLCPIVFIALPPAGKQAGPDLTRIGSKAAPDGFPVIPVEATDVVALYRVAQESIGRARAAGGPALIECVASNEDSIVQLASHLTTKNIATARWIASVSPDFCALLPRKNEGRPGATR